MTVVREGDALTLLNTVRLSEDGLAALDELGTVTHTQARVALAAMSLLGLHLEIGRRIVRILRDFLGWGGGVSTVAG